VARAIDIYEDYKLNVTALEALIISRVEHNLAKTVKPAEARKRKVAPALPASLSHAALVSCLRRTIGITRSVSST